MSGARRVKVVGLAAALLAAAALSAEKAPVRAGPQGEGLAAQVKRLEMDLEALKAAVKAKDQLIVKQRDEIVAWRERAAAAEASAKDTLRRVQQLAERLRETEQELARLKAGGAAPPAAINPKGANPPPGAVKGKIEQVSPTDKAVVTISIGSDAGLNVGHTLEVYRLKPQPKYLGRIQIIRTSPRNAVGRLTRPLPKGETLEVGDEVASAIR